MLASAEILRILLAIIAMGLGILVFRMAYKVTNAKTIQGLFGFKKPSIPQDKISVYHACYSKYLNSLAILCFVIGALFAYIPDVKISLGFAIIGCLAGAMMVWIGYRKAIKLAML